jgi:multiple sugar transport system substrate-binding protein
LPALARAKRDKYISFHKFVLKLKLMKNPNKKLIIVALIFAFLATTGAQCGTLPGGAIKTGKPDAITLNYWKVFDEKSNLSELISLYQKQNPHVTINYKTFTADEYESELLNALAEDRGPDIFSIQATWMGKYAPKIQPLPDKITTYSTFESGTIQKQTYTKANVKNTLTLRNINELFPDVVANNQVIDGKIYGLPLSIDSLALFYNRDLLNNAGITAPPTTWDEFVAQVGRLTKKDADGNILQAGAALGTANNVSRSTDILSLLMMQSGAPMTDSSGKPTFNKNSASYSGQTLASASALNFYNSFASPSTEFYSWDAEMPNSRQAFMENRTAFYLGYAYDIPVIKTQAPKLNFDIAKIPQQNTTAINFANYWAETVSKKSKNPNEAWDFALFITTNAENNKKYITKAQKPVALKSLIDWQKQQTGINLLAPFDDQLLTARSWYKGKDAIATENILKTLITNNLLGADKTEKLINTAVTQINGTM